MKIHLLAVAILLFAKSARPQLVQDKLSWTFQGGDTIKKFSQKGAEYIATIYLRQDKTFEYFYSNTKFLFKYSIGRIVYKGQDTLFFKSDTSLAKISASNLIKKNKDLKQYFFQPFNNEVFYFSNNNLYEFKPITDRNSKKAKIKVCDLLRSK